MAEADYGRAVQAGEARERQGTAEVLRPDEDKRKKPWANSLGVRSRGVLPQRVNPLARFCRGGIPMRDLRHPIC